MSMIINRFVNSFVFWAAWIIIPVIMEIIPSIGSIVVLIKKKIKPVKYDIPIIYPEISLLIPVYNSQDSLEACISSIYESDYPNDKIRIFLVNNQGQDNSFNVFAECQKKFPELMMQWLNAKQGKSKALNLALFNSDGKYIIHIDSDGILEKTALTNMVNKFEADLSIDCMTGAIMTMPDQVEEYKGFFAKLLRKMEFMEYAQAFLAGRNYASELNAIYTLSGAFSAFRKSTVLKSQLYNTDTICEDTQITFQMKYLQKKRVYMCENAIFYVDPIEDMNKLYTQRQRWQRGSLEVAKMFMDKNFKLRKFMSDISVKTLLYDHTFAFPRMIWYLALICLMVVGYSGKVILLSTGIIFALYILTGFLYFITAAHYLKINKNATGDKLEFKKADGTAISGMNVTESKSSELDVIAKGEDTNKVWAYDIALDASGNPVVLYDPFTAAEDGTTTGHTYYYARWNGTAWESTAITTGDGVPMSEYKAVEGNIFKAKSYQAGGICFGANDLNTVYLSKKAAEGTFEIYRYETTDNGATWAEKEVITSGTPAGELNIRPIAIKDAPADVFWMQGMYDNPTNYKTSISCAGEGVATTGIFFGQDSYEFVANETTNLDVRFAPLFQPIVLLLQTKSIRSNQAIREW